MTSGMFDEHAIIEALKIIASKGYAKILIEQDSSVLYECHHGILEEALERLEGKAEPPKLIYVDKSPEPQLQVVPVQSQPQRIRRSEAKAVKFHNKRAEIVALPATLTFEQWQQTLKDFDNKCAYCLTGNYEVLEHFIPLIFGGGTTEYNCVPACSSCNGIKSDQHPSMISASSRITDALQRVQRYLEVRKG
jgi:5-methylcytosine-specific restriction endonuclease McrA